MKHTLIIAAVIMVAILALYFWAKKKQDEAGSNVNPATTTPEILPGTNYNSGVNRGDVPPGNNGTINNKEDFLRG